MDKLTDSQRERLKNLSGFFAKASFLVNCRVAHNFSEAGTILNSLRTEKASPPRKSAARDQASAYRLMESRGLA